MIFPCGGRLYLRGARRAPRAEGGERVTDLKYAAKMAAAGIVTGAVNGAFGGGGGMVFLPILSRWGRLDQRKLYATCVGVIFPVCLVSAAVYLFRGELSLLTALPYLLGGLAGGWIGGKLYGKISVRWLKWLFAAFLFYAGVKYLL